MIFIQDYDEPLEVASKITTGIRPATDDSPLERLARGVAGIAGNTERMYSLEQIKEIADYLKVYYDNHIYGGKL